MPRPTSRSCSRHRPGSTRRRRSSTARSWRSTRRGGRTSPCSRSGSASGGSARRAVRRAQGRWCTRSSTSSTSTAAPCSTCRSRIASGSSAPCCARRPGSGSPPISRARAKPSWRRLASEASRGSSPSSAGLDTSPGDERLPGSRSRSARSRSSWSAAGRRARGMRATWGRLPSASTRTGSCGSPARWGPASMPRPGSGSSPRWSRWSSTRRRSIRRRRATTAAAGAAT